MFFNVMEEGHILLCEDSYSLSHAESSMNERDNKVFSPTNAQLDSL